MNELCNILFDCVDGSAIAISTNTLFAASVPLTIILFFALILVDAPRSQRDTKTPLVLLGFGSLVVSALMIAIIKGTSVLGLWIFDELTSISISATQFAIWLGAVILFSIALRVSLTIRNRRWNDGQ